MDTKERRAVLYSLDIIAAMYERAVRMIWLLAILLTVLLAASTGGFLWYLSQYDYESYTEAITQDGNGINFIGTQDGGISNRYESNVQGDKALSD